MRALIADDETHARNRIRRLLSHFPEIEIIGEAKDGLEACEYIERSQPDVAFLDIEMPGLDGLGVARRVTATSVIFTTAHEHHALDAFDLRATDYLLKPIRRERLAQALDRISDRQRNLTVSNLPSQKSNSENRPLIARAGTSTYFFDPFSITRFYSNMKYTAIQVEGIEYLIEQSLAQLELQLENTAPGKYLRVHRGELIRLDAIRGLHQSSRGIEVELRDGQRANVSRRVASRLKSALGLA